MRYIVSEWNFLDTFIYKLDVKIAKIKEFIFPDEPDVEFMIEVETSYLKKENEQLKELHYPKGITVQDRSYYCPNRKCKTKIENILIEQYRIKHCPECGQRIFLNKCYRATDFNS
jgi:hypothetical protein